jgi:hypothetical protein
MSTFSPKAGIEVWESKALGAPGHHASRLIEQSQFLPTAPLARASETPLFAIWSNWLLPSVETVRSTKTRSDSLARPMRSGRRAVYNGIKRLCRRKPSWKKSGGA